MKYLLSLSIVLFLVSCNPNFDKKENKRVVNEMLVGFLTAIENNDYDTLEKLTHNDFVIYENGSVWNLDQLTTELESFKNVNVSYTLGHIHSIVDENVAHLQFKNNGIFAYTDTTLVLNFIESATFVKDNGNWYLRFYHSTHLKRSESK